MQSNSRPVYSTSTESANMARTGRLGMLRVAAAPRCSICAEHGPAMYSPCAECGRLGDPE